MYFFPGFAVAAVVVVDEDDPAAENRNVLLLAGDTNVIKGSNNEGTSDDTFFKVSNITYSASYTVNNE